jgi:hypothetical protein
MLSTCLVSAALLAPRAVAAAHRDRPDCAPAQAQTLASDRYVQVYSLAGQTPGQGGTYACLRGGAGAVALSQPHPGVLGQDSIAHVALAGTIVAYTESTHGVDTGSTNIVVVNVASRRTLLTIPGVGGFVDACIISFHEITDLVVSRRGSVAWIVREGTHCTTATLGLYSAGISAAPALLEEGPAIVPGSLRVSRQTVSWKNRGQRRSARLP